MNDTKRVGHTPGNWTVNSNYSGSYTIEEAVERLETNGEELTNKQIEEDLANKNLISAAPELLEACKMAINQNDLPINTIEVLERAIAKAEKI